MAKHANIVSFEEAKAKSSRRARNAASSNEKHSAKREGTTSAARKDADRSAGASTSRRSSNKRAAASSSVSRTSSMKRSRAEEPKAKSRARTNSAQAKSSRSSDRRETKRRERTKSRAIRLFDKQYAGSSKEAATSEGAPRAAVYEGKAGSSQKRSAQMQLASEAEPVSAKINPAGWFSNLNIKPSSLKIATAVICFVLVGVFLYTPAQQYYQSLREHDRLEAEYAVIEQRNQVLDEQNDSLAGDAGMEDAARQKYGYVVKGDQTAVVTGLSEATTDTSRDGDSIEANVLASSVKAPEDWYTPYLDAFFGVSQ